MTGLADQVRDHGIPERAADHLATRLEVERLEQEADAMRPEGTEIASATPTSLAMARSKRARSSPSQSSFRRQPANARRQERGGRWIRCLGMAMTPPNSIATGP